MWPLRGPWTIRPEHGAPRNSRQLRPMDRERLRVEYIRDHFRTLKFDVVMESHHALLAHERAQLLMTRWRIQHQETAASSPSDLATEDAEFLLHVFVQRCRARHLNLRRKQTLRLPMLVHESSKTVEVAGNYCVL